MFGQNSATYASLTNSALVDNVVFKNGATARMTTSNRYDNLNRLTLKESRTGVSPVSSFNYAYNSANQRTGDQHNVTCFCLFHSDQSLMETLALREFTLRRRANENCA